MSRLSDRPAHSESAILNPQISPRRERLRVALIGTEPHDLLLPKGAKEILPVVRPSNNTPRSFTKHRCTVAPWGSKCRFPEYRLSFPSPMNPIVIRLGRLGDMTLLAPLLRCIHLRYGLPCILIGSGGWSDEIYAGHPDVAQVWPILQRHRSPTLSLEYRRLATALAKRSGPIYVCETEPGVLAKLRWLLAKAGVTRQRVVYLTDQCSADTEHLVDRLLRFAAQTPADFEPRRYHLASSMTTPPAPRLCLNERDRADRTDWLKRRGFSDRRIVLVQPANKRTMRWNGRRPAAQDSKFWPLSSWHALLNAVQVSLPDAIVLLCGSPREGNVLEAMQRDIGGGSIAVAAYDLPIRRLMSLLEIAHSMISVDTGPAHLAAALDCPLVVLFGSCSPAQWLPRSPTDSPVIALGGPPRFTRADQIAPDEVIAAWRSLVDPSAGIAIGTRVTARPTYKTEA
jgi:ADP-heptose:LPS heptosyltransferase